MLTSNPLVAFLVDETYVELLAVLVSDIGRNLVSELKVGDFSETAQDFSRLLFAFADAKVQDLARNPHHPRSQQVLTDLLDLLCIQGYEEAGMSA